MKKHIIVILLLVLVVLVLPYVWVEINTMIYYNDTIDMYKASTMISSDNYHKVIYFGKDHACVLYCEPTRVLLCEFSKTTNDTWVCDNYKPVLSKGSLIESEFYPIYPTKHLISPQESKENFKRYEELLRSFSEGNELQFSVTLSNNKIDRDISLVNDKSEIIISLYNDYDGFSGCETAEITYFSSVDFDLSLFTEIQKLCMHEGVSESECIEFLDSEEYSGSNSKVLKEKFPNNIEVKSKDILNNGEYVISYVKSSNENILYFRGLTKR